MKFDTIARKHAEQAHQSVAQAKQPTVSSLISSRIVAVARLGLLGFVVVAVAAAIAGIWIVGSGSRTLEAGSSPDDDSTSTIPNAGASDVPLVSVGTSYLFQATMLPADMDQCGEITGRMAQYCAADRGAKITIQLLELPYARMSGGVEVEGWPDAAWLATGDTATLGIRLGGEMGLTLTSAAVPESQLIEVAESIPLIGDADSFEVDRSAAIDPLTGLADETAATILGIGPSEVYRGDSGWVPRTNMGDLRLMVDSSPSMLGHAATMLYPELVDGLPVRAIAGFGTGSQAHLGRIVWSQRGLVWTLQADEPLDEIHERVRTAIEVIANI